jgi:hypothetical protein
MIISLIAKYSIGIVLGAAIGGVAGYFSKCAGST